MPKDAGSTEPGGPLPLSPAGRKPPDALVYRYTSNGVIAHTVVSGHATIKAFQRAGWSILVHEQDVRYADLEQVRELDIQRFEDWRDAWRIGL